MQPEEHSGVPGGKKGNRQAPRTAQVESVPIKDRIHSLIYGYLLTNGLHTTAEALQQESEYLRNTIPHPDPSKPSRVVVLNDRLHDRNLEEIVHIFNRESYFHLHGKMLDFASELSHLNTKFQTIASQFGAPNLSRLQQQLYGRYVSRTPQARNFSTSPAPQAIAAMRLHQINKMAAERYDAQSSKNGGVSIVQIPQQQQRNQQQEEQQFQQHSQEQQESFEQADLHGSSRRKHTQPVHMHNRYGNTLHTLVDRINEGNYEVDANLDLDFLHTLEFNPLSFDLNRGYQEDLQFYEDVFNQENVNKELTLQHDVADDEVTDTQELRIDHRAREYSSPPEELLSPIPRAPDYRPQGSSSQLSTLESQSARIAYSDSHTIAESRFDGREKDDEEKDKRSGKSESKGERSSRNSSPARSQARHEESRRHREREKREEKERSSQERQEKRKDDGRDSRDIPSSSSHRQPSEDNRSKHRDDRESTPSSSSSRTTDRKDDDKERRRRERKEREKRDAEAREKEKQREKAKKEKEDREKLKYSNQPSSSSGASVEYQPQHVLNTMRTSHAASSEPSSSGNGKRKVEATIQSDNKSVPFKIPKKNSHESSRTSSPRPRKSPPPGTMTDGGDDRAVATHFFSPKGHLARLCSILHNCDEKYKEYHEQHPPTEDTKADSLSPPSSAPPHSNVTLVPNPKGKMFAPMKGDRSTTGTVSQKSSSSSSGTYESSDDDSNEKKSSGRSSSSSSNDSMSKRPVDDTLAQKLLDRVHKKK